MRKTGVFLFVCLLTTALSFGEAVTFNSNERIEIFDLGVWVPCAMDGAGELVYLNGTLHVITQWTIDGKGIWHINTHYQAQRLVGYGESSGDRYNGNGVIRWNFKLAGGSGSEMYIASSVENLKFIGKGKGNNLLLQHTLHITVNANGTMTAYVDNFIFECK